MSGAFSLQKYHNGVRSTETMHSRGPYKMEIGYREMAEINLQLSEICFAAESEVEKIFRADSGE